MPLKANPLIKFKVIYQDNNLIVIDKPAGLITHPTKSEQDNTLVNGLIAHCPEIKDVGDPPASSSQVNLRPGLIHRLDKDTSGLMVVAKNNKTFSHFKKQFQERKVIKYYLALVIGQIKEKRGIITKAISFSKKNRLKRSVLLDEKAKPAWTEYKVLKRFKDYSLLEVYLKTGRTHQIRVHLSSIGHPIAGDKQYKFKRQICPDGLNRQFLHAGYLKFQSTDGKMMEFKSELPSELKETLKGLPRKQEDVY